MPRRTKIIATIGPKTSSKEQLAELILAGANVLRVNLSHGNMATQRQTIENILEVSKEQNIIVGIIADLQGPKIRIAGFFDNQVVTLVKGQEFILDSKLDKTSGTTTEVGLDYPELYNDVAPDDKLLLDDGKIVLQVKFLQSNKIICEVITGGKLSSNKGLNKLGGGLSAPCVTEKDLRDLEFLAKLPIDYIALSFVKDQNDINRVREFLAKNNSHAKLIAKIERIEAIDNIDNIIKAADAIMVARGDLGVELGYAQLPGVQKVLITKAALHNKVAIVATQMMESMIHNPIPTRAEVSDVANAVLDGTDCVMVSQETATGDYPTEVIKSLDKICSEAEEYGRANILPSKKTLERHDEAIAHAAMHIANQVQIKAIVALTESGSTPLWMSRVHSAIPIYALGRDNVALGRMTLFRGVYPVYFDVTNFKSWEISTHALKLLENLKVLAKNDKVILTKGHIVGIKGNTNTLKILDV